MLMNIERKGQELSIKYITTCSILYSASQSEYEVIWPNFKFEIDHK